MKFGFTALLISTTILSASPAWARSPALERILTRAGELSAEGRVPVVVMDLDETVVDSMPRRFHSYQLAVTELCGTLRSGDCARAVGLNLSELQTQPNRYRQEELFRSVGITDTKWFRRLEAISLEIYLSGNHIDLDQAVPGAVEYIQDLRGAGTKVFFVSSRWESRQGRGTRESLRHLGMLPRGADEDVILRPDGMGSIEFKRSSFDHVRKWADANDGVVIGAFENEPENLNAMKDAFPAAARVFIKGAYLKDEHLENGFTEISSYR